MEKITFIVTNLILFKVSNKFKIKMDKDNFSLENHVMMIFATYGLVNFITDFYYVMMPFFSKDKKVQDQVQDQEDQTQSESESDSESSIESLIVINDISSSDDETYYLRKKRKII